MSSLPEINDWFDITVDGGSSPITFSSSTAVTNYNFYGVYQLVRLVGATMLVVLEPLTKSIIDNKIVRC